MQSKRILPNYGRRRVLIDTYLQLFGIRLVSNPSIVYLAKNAGFDALFIELEHSTLSTEEVTRLCMVSLPNGITPFVRVPYQCGYGLVQRVLDSGAMGIIFPHIHNKGKEYLSHLLACASLI